MRLFKRRPYSTAAATLAQDVEALWVAGVLPYRLGEGRRAKRWVCGFRIYKSPESTSLQEVCCGPKRPRSFNPRLTVVTVRAPRELEIISGNW